MSILLNPQKHLSKRLPHFINMVIKMEKIKIGFIGAGNMGAAIMKGISKSEAGKNIEL